MSKIKKETVEGRRSHTNMVLEARRGNVALTKELHNTMKALRHSNAICAYLLAMMIDKADPSGIACRIPFADYQKLVADDSTGIKIEYTDSEVLVRLTKAADLELPRTGPVAP